MPDPSSESAKLDVAVIGAGIAGLSAAFRLHERSPGLRAGIFEASDRSGGYIETAWRDGFLIERGADAILAEQPHVKDLIHTLGLTDEVVPVNARFRRSFVVRKGRLVAVPEGFHLIAPARFGPFWSSPLFSLSGKARMSLEWFRPARKGTDDESVEDFIRRRFGDEAYLRAGQPLISGIYSGHPGRLSAQAVLKRFYELERRYGSVIKGLRIEEARQKGSAAGPRYGLFLSFRNGLSALPDALIRALPAGWLHTSRAVTGLESAAGGGWIVRFANGSRTRASKVLITTAAYQAAALLESIRPEAAADLAKIPYESAVSIQFAYRRSCVGHALDGFGFVVPPDEGFSLIGCSFADVKFPGRTPEGSSLIRAFAGGAFGRALLERDDADLIRMVRRDLEKLLSIRGEPLFCEWKRYPRSLPQYEVGHTYLVEDIEEHVRGLPGLFLSGNAYRGVGIADSIAHAQDTAARMLESL